MPSTDKFHKAIQALELARNEVIFQALSYLKSEVIAYSKAHPMREVRLVLGMGSIGLYVEAHGDALAFGIFDDGFYDLSPGLPGCPEFMSDVHDMGEDYDLHLTSSLYSLTCRNGEVVEEMHEW